MNVLKQTFRFPTIWNEHMDETTRLRVFEDSSKSSSKAHITNRQVLGSYQVRHSRKLAATIDLNNNNWSFNAELTYPWISADTVAPCLSIIASISSITSKYASLLVYLTPARRQGTLESWPVGRTSETFVLPVTWLVMVLKKFGGFIRSWRTLSSVVKG